MKKLLKYILALTFALTPSLAKAQTSFVTGNISASAANCGTAAACVSLGLARNSGGASFTISGNYSGTLQFEASADGGNFSSLSVTPSAGTSAVTSTTGTGLWSANVSAFNVVRVRASALASGGVTVMIQASLASAQIPGSGSGSGVSSLTCDGILLACSGSTGAVTQSQATAAADTVYGNATGSTATPGFTTNPVVASVGLVGTTAGFFDLGQGSTSSAATLCAASNSICVQAPTSVTSYLLTMPTAAPGVAGSYAATSTGGVQTWASSNEQFCGTTSACSATAEANAKIVFGSAPLVSGTPSTVTISGISPAFTSSSDYVCTVSAPGATAATALIGVTNVSSSSFTITGPGSVSTVISYICVGF
jgi:hypothetical protein